MIFRIEIDTENPDAKDKVRAWVEKINNQAGMDVDATGTVHYDCTITAFADGELVYGSEFDGKANNAENGADADG